MSHDCHLSILPDWRAEFKRLEGAYAPATLKSYHTDVCLFVEWCGKEGKCPLPATIETVCAFLQNESIALCPSSVRRRLYAIRKVHRLLRLPDPTYDEDIAITLRRVRRAKLNRPKQAKGMTRDYLDVNRRANGTPDRRRIGTPLRHHDTLGPVADFALALA